MQTVILVSELTVSCCLRNNLQSNELQQSNLLQNNGFFLQMMSQPKVRKISFTPAKGIHVNNGDTAHAICVTQNTSSLEIY